MDEKPNDRAVGWGIPFAVVMVWLFVDSFFVIPQFQRSVHRQGGVDHATGEWQAEYHEPTDSWKVWEVGNGN